MSKSLQTTNSEKLFLAILLIITILQFATWGEQTVKHLLGLIFQTPLPNTTFLDPLIGIVAIVASILLFIGTVLRWQNKTTFGPYLILGAVLFVFKSLFSIFNEILIAKQRYSTITESHIEELASSIGAELFIVAIWAGILTYFLRIAKKTMEFTPSSK